MSVCVCLSFSSLTPEPFDVAMCGMSVLEGLWGKNTDKDTSREGASTLRRFHYY